MMTQWWLNNDEEGNVGIDDKNDSNDDNANVETIVL